MYSKFETYKFEKKFPITLIILDRLPLPPNILGNFSEYFAKSVATTEANAKRPSHHASMLADGAISS